MRKQTYLLHTATLIEHDCFTYALHDVWEAVGCTPVNAGCKRGGQGCDTHAFDHQHCNGAQVRFMYVPTINCLYRLAGAKVNPQLLLASASVHSQWCQSRITSLKSKEFVHQQQKQQQHEQEEIWASSYKLGLEMARRHFATRQNDEPSSRDAHNNALPVLLPQKTVLCQVIFLLILNKAVLLQNKFFVWYRVSATYRKYCYQSQKTGCWEAVVPPTCLYCVYSVSHVESAFKV